MVVLTFPRELDMTAALLRSAASFDCVGWTTTLEFEGPQGVPDVVFSRFSSEAIAKRQMTPLPTPILKRRDAAIIATLTSGRARHLDEIAARARMSVSTARVALRSLQAVGAVETNGRGWRATTDYPSPLVEAVAIELKLADWRRALGQAIRYQAFAERSYVVLSEHHAAAPATGASSFRLYNVGLAALSPWGRIDFIRRPRRKRPTDAIARFVAGERLWLAQLRMSLAA